MMSCANFCVQRNSACQRATRIMPAPDVSAVRVIETIGRLDPRPSPLRPSCSAVDRMFKWRGVHIPPSPVLDNPLLRYLLDIATRESLSDTTSVGSALRKLHIFYDIFSVPESEWLPASPALLHSFALWAAADPDPLDPGFPSLVPWETVAAETVGKYLSGKRAWHIAQGWPPPLSDADAERIQFSLRGLAKMQKSRRSRPPRPPITITMMRALRLSLDLSNSFDACVWAACCCAFWGLMRFGEVTVRSRAAFSPSDH
jgi:hypothetical protein